MGWNYQDHAQCEDRCHRIGQKDNVTAYYFIAKGTIEEDIYDLLERKKQVFDEVMETKNFTDISEKDISSVYKDLLDRMTQKYAHKTIKK